jgi:hypothetical protein
MSDGTLVAVVLAILAVGAIAAGVLLWLIERRKK